MMMIMCMISHCVAKIRIILIGNLSVYEILNITIRMLKYEHSLRAGCDRRSVIQDLFLQFICCDAEMAFIIHAFAVFHEQHLW